VLDRVKRFFGRYWFKQLVRDPIPANVSDITAHDYPLRFIRPQGLPLVSFSYEDEFERDIQPMGWKPYTGEEAMEEAMAILGKMATGVGVTMGRAYAKKLDDQNCTAHLWILLDPPKKKGCMYAASYIPKEE